MKTQRHLQTPINNPPPKPKRSPDAAGQAKGEGRGDGPRESKLANLSEPSIINPTSKKETIAFSLWERDLESPRWRAYPKAFLALLLTLAAALPLRAEETPSSEPAPTPAPLAYTKIAAYPESLHLSGADSSQRLIVLAWDSAGGTHDLSSLAMIDSATCASFSNGTLDAIRNGRESLEVRYQNHSTKIDLTVSDIEKPRRVSFIHDVIPILTVSGCNSGGCHGAARGKDGFRLSLFGYDPAGDFERLTHELVGRRLNLAVPEDSLLLLKAGGKVRHGGGVRMTPGSQDWQDLLAWLENGAPPEPKDSPSLAGLQVYPKELVLDQGSGPRGLVAQARLSNGQTRDVTSRAVFMTSNNHCAALEGPSLRPGAPGEAQILVRYGSFTESISVIVRPANPSLGEFRDNDSHPFDALINSRLRKLRTPPVELCRDDEFLRRASLDIIGRLPNLEEQKLYFSEPENERRSRFVERSLKSPEFNDLWVLKWAERLRLRSTRDVSPRAVLAYEEWLRDQIAAERPLDEIVRELLTANGSTFTEPATNFFHIERDPLKLAEDVAQVFLGMRIQCAQCHNHPFDRWTQDDYYGFAAFFPRIARKRGADPRELVVTMAYGGDVRHPVGNQPVAPKFLGAERPDIKPGQDRRLFLANWIASKDNPAFTRNLANMVWDQFFGAGITDPIDDARVSNPPVNSALLGALADRLAASKFNLRALVREICSSRAYQRSCAGPPGQITLQRNFGRSRLRRIRAEVLLDAISDVTETHEKFRGLPLGQRATKIADGAVNTPFLETFGRPMRESACTCELRLEPTLSQALHLINGATVTSNIRRGNLIGRRLKEGKKPLEIIDEIYRRALCRPPNPKEKEAIRAQLQKSRDKGKILEDIFWAILNSREFLFNH